MVRSWLATLPLATFACGSGRADAVGRRGRWVQLVRCRPALCARYAVRGACFRLKVGAWANSAHGATGRRSEATTRAIRALLFKTETPELADCAIDALTALGAAAWRVKLPRWARIAASLALARANTVFVHVGRARVTLCRARSRGVEACAAVHAFICAVPHLVASATACETRASTPPPATRS